jgi:hypothetical protein
MMAQESFLDFGGVFGHLKWRCTEDVRRRYTRIATAVISVEVVLRNLQVLPQSLIRLAFIPAVFEFAAHDLGVTRQSQHT